LKNNMLSLHLKPRLKFSVTSMDSLWTCFTCSRRCRRKTNLTLILIKSSVSRHATSSWVTMWTVASSHARSFAFYTRSRSASLSKLWCSEVTTSARLSLGSTVSSTRSRDVIKYLCGKLSTTLSIICHWLLWSTKKSCVCTEAFQSLWKTSKTLLSSLNPLIFPMKDLWLIYSGMIQMRMSPIGRRMKEAAVSSLVASSFKNSLISMTSIWFAVVTRSWRTAMASSAKTSSW